MLEPIDAVREFLERGGDVLTWIGLVTFVMWALILERLWYFRRVHPREAARVGAVWDRRSDQTSWYAQRTRELLLSRIKLQLDQFIPMIKALVALCPLLGLLGTVTGMIEVFDVMAIAGSSNARAMAAGVSKATIPTMAGMVAALSGLVFSVQIERFARDEAQRMEDRLAHH